MLIENKVISKNTITKARAWYLISDPNHPEVQRVEIPEEELRINDFLSDVVVTLKEVDKEDLNVSIMPEAFGFTNIHVSCTKYLKRRTFPFLFEWFISFLQNKDGSMFLKQYLVFNTQTLNRPTEIVIELTDQREKYNGLGEMSLVDFQVIHRNIILKNLKDKGIRVLMAELQNTKQLIVNEEGELFKYKDNLDLGLLKRKSFNKNEHELEYGFKVLNPKKAPFTNIKECHKMGFIPTSSDERERLLSWISNSLKIDFKEQKFEIFCHSKQPTKYPAYIHPKDVPFEKIRNVMISAHQDIMSNPELTQKGIKLECLPFPVKLNLGNTNRNFIKGFLEILENKEALIDFGLNSYFKFDFKVEHPTKVNLKHLGNNLYSVTLSHQGPEGPREYVFYSYIRYYLETEAGSDKYTHNDYQFNSNKAKPIMTSDSYRVVLKFLLEQLMENIHTLDSEILNDCRIVHDQKYLLEKFYSKLKEDYGNIPASNDRVPFVEFAKTYFLV